MANLIEIDPDRPQAFLSYTHDDNDFLDEAISRLRVDIEKAVPFVSGQNFKIFQDADGIGFGQYWLDRLEEALRQARFFIPVITPSYFGSEACRSEAFRFMKYEASAGRNDLILPIYLQTTPFIDDQERQSEDKLATCLASRQHRDWRKLIHLQREDPERRKALMALASDISDAACRDVKPEKVPALEDGASFLFDQDPEIDALKKKIETLEKKLQSTDSGDDNLLQRVLGPRVWRNLGALCFLLVFVGIGQSSIIKSRLETHYMAQIETLRMEARTEAKTNEQLGKSVGELVSQIKERTQPSSRLISALELKDSSVMESAEVQSLIAGAKSELKILALRASKLEQELEALKGRGRSGTEDEQFAHLAAQPGRQDVVDSRPIEPEDQTSEIERALAETTQKREEGLESTRPGDQFRDCSYCPEMVSIPAGMFSMGSPVDENDRYDDEGPLRQVTIDRPFGLGKYEVTRGEFALFVSRSGYEATGCAFHDGKDWVDDQNLNWLSPGYEQTDDDPVVCVNWDDTRAYAGWLSEETGETYRLPSEAEWEYAARAGSSTSYFWGDDIGMACDYANGYDQKGREIIGLPYETFPCDDGYAQTAPVGSFRPNAFGLHDMTGNVWEWVEDSWHDDYEGAPTDQRAWIESGDERRVLRGGSWRYNPRNLRTAKRRKAEHDNRNRGDGFRIAKTLRR